MDEGHAIEAELPEFGYPLPEQNGKSGFILHWKRRIKRADVDYHLLLSHDLQSWETDPPELETLDVTPQPDGVMETVRAKVGITGPGDFFIGVKAKKK